MKNKVFLVSLFLIFVLFLTSCGVVPISDDGGQLTFTLGDEVATKIL